MILIALAALLLVAAGGAGLLGVGVLSADRNRQRTGLLAVASAPVILAAGALVLAVLVLGLGGGPHEQGEAPAAPTAERSAGNVTTAERPAGTVTASERPAGNVVAPVLPEARIAGAPSDLQEVRIDATDADRGFAPYRPVSGLVPGAVVRVRAEGFGWYDVGSVAQCVSELGRQTACGPPFPVQFDEDGRADVQFAVRGDISVGGCRVAQATCLLRLSAGSGRQGSAQIVLVDRVGAAQVRVEPGGAVADGQTVEVVVAGFPPGVSAAAVLCAPPEAYDARRCAAPVPGSTFLVDAAGAGRTTLRVAAGRLGPDAALCGPRRLCGIAVLAGPGYVAAPVTPVRFALGPGVDYEARRLLPGVGVAVVLIGIALVVARRTDWTKPTEAATPALDRADLRAGASLDDLFGTDEELAARDPVPW